MGGVTYVVGPAIFQWTSEGQSGADIFFKYTTETLHVEVTNGSITVNGKDYGVAKPGDIVRFFASGLVTVNGIKREGVANDQITRRSTEHGLSRI